MYGVRQSHSEAEWSALLTDGYLWIDFCCIPQPGAERMGSPALAQVSTLLCPWYGALYVYVSVC
jgi:hypothetical protein